MGVFRCSANRADIPAPDEKYLYVTNWDEKRKIVMRCEANADGALADMTSAPGEDALDGMKVDR